MEFNSGFKGLMQHTGMEHIENSPYN